jgi:hypothetical protein
MSSRSAELKASETVTVAEYARRRGCSASAVSQAVKRGRLGDAVTFVNGRPRIAPALADSEWRDRSQAKRPFRSPSKKRGKAKLAIVSSAMLDAQRAVFMERARKLQLDNGLKSGELVEVWKVKREAFESARTIRKALTSIASRLSAEIAAESNADVIYRKLEKEIAAALNAAADALAAEGVDAK